MNAPIGDSLARLLQKNIDEFLLKADKILSSKNYSELRPVMARSWGAISLAIGQIEENIVEWKGSNPSTHIKLLFDTCRAQITVLLDLLNPNLVAGISSAPAVETEVGITGEFSCPETAKNFPPILKQESIQAPQISPNLPTNTRAKTRKGYPPGCACACHEAFREFELRAKKAEKNDYNFQEIDTKTKTAGPQHSKKKFLSDDPNEIDAERLFLDFEEGRPVPVDRIRNPLVLMHLSQRVLDSLSLSQDEALRQINETMNRFDVSLNSANPLNVRTILADLLTKSKDFEEINFRPLAREMSEEINFGEFEERFQKKMSEALQKLLHCLLVQAQAAKAMDRFDAGILTDVYDQVLKEAEATNAELIAKKEEEIRRMEAQRLHDEYVIISLKQSLAEATGRKKSLIQGILALREREDRDEGEEPAKKSFEILPQEIQLQKHSDALGKVGAVVALNAKQVYKLIKNIEKSLATGTITADQKAAMADELQTAYLDIVSKLVGVLAPCQNWGSFADRDTVILEGLQQINFRDLQKKIILAEAETPNRRAPVPRGGSKESSKEESKPSDNSLPHRRKSRGGQAGPLRQQDSQTYTSHKSTVYPGESEMSLPQEFHAFQSKTGYMVRKSESRARVRRTVEPVSPEAKMDQSPYKKMSTLGSKPRKTGVSPSPEKQTPPPQQPGHHPRRVSIFVHSPANSHFEVQEYSDEDSDSDSPSPRPNRTSVAKGSNAPSGQNSYIGESEEPTQTKSRQQEKSPTKGSRVQIGSNRSNKSVVSRNSAKKPPEIKTSPKKEVLRTDELAKPDLRPKLDRLASKSSSQNRIRRVSFVEPNQFPLIEETVQQPQSHLSKVEEGSSDVQLSEKTPSGDPSSENLGPEPLANKKSLKNVNIFRLKNSIPEKAKQSSGYFAPFIKKGEVFEDKVPSDFHSPSRISQVSGIPSVSFPFSFKELIFQLDLLDQPTAQRALDHLISKLGHPVGGDGNLLPVPRVLTESQPNSAAHSIDGLHLQTSAQNIKGETAPTKPNVVNARSPQSQSDEKFFPKIGREDRPAFYQTFIENNRANPMTMTRLTPFLGAKTNDFNDLKTKDLLRRKSLKPVPISKPVLVREKTIFAPQTDLLGECMSNFKIGLSPAPKEPERPADIPKFAKRNSTFQRPLPESEAPIDRVMNSIFLKTPSRLGLTINRLLSPEAMTPPTPQWFLKEISDPSVTLKNVSNPLFTKVKAKIMAAIPDLGTEKSWDRLDSNIRGCIVVFLKEHRECGATCNHVASFADSLKILIGERPFAKTLKPLTMNNF